MDYETQKQIRNRIAQLAQTRQQVRAQDVSIPEKEKPQFVAVFLFTAIILLAVTTALLMFWKGDSPQTHGPALSGGFQRIERPVNPEIQPHQSPSVEIRLSSLEERMKVWQYRLWLLGLANNENVAQLKKMDTDHHRVNNRGFVTFDSDWTLNRVPDSMQLTEEQRQQIIHGPK